MRVYTRAGDKGKTSLYGNKQVEKDNPQVLVLGSIDELNSALGLFIAHIDIEKQSEIRNFLVKLQEDLFLIGTYLAGANKSLKQIGKRVTEMEKLIDNFNKQLPKIHHFILPNGAKEACFAHSARSICRRVEREVVRLSRKKSVNKKIIIYLNRLSDLLFILARYLNLKAGAVEMIWKLKEAN